MNMQDSRYMQYVAALTGTLSVCTAALYGAWTSPILPKIAAGNSPLGNITIEESSWIVSSFQLGHIPTSILSGWIMETVGRRGALLWCGPFFLAPWFLIAFSSSVWLTCLARLCAGLSLSVAFSIVPMYNGEIAEKEVRGRLGSSFNIMGLTGELIIFCIGPYVSFSALTLVCSVVPLLFMLVFYFMPESPYYLLKIGKEDEAKKNLKRLLKSNISKSEFEEQVNVIKASIEDANAHKTSLWKFVSKAEYRYALMLSFGIQTLHQLSGFVAIVSYMQTIIQSGQSTVSPEISSVIIGLVQFPAVFIAAAIVDKAGRKPLFIISSLGCAVALIVEGVYFYFQDVMHSDVSNLSWIPTFGILLYVVMRPVGIGTLTFILMGELFSVDIRAHACAVSSLYNTILSFIVAKSFEPISNAWGMHVMFTLFAVICVLGAVFIYVSVPETKGKTFIEIKDKLHRSNKVAASNTVIKPI